MQNIATLYIAQVSYAQLEQRLKELTQLQRSQDAIVLLEDSVFALTSLAHEAWQNIYVLQADAHLLAADDLANNINVIDYVQLAEMIAQAQKVITWK